VAAAVGDALLSPTPTDYCILPAGEVNPSYYNIVREYYRLSGIPSLINTSFNMHEEPIVNSPKDAIRAFLEGNLDYLAIGNFLVAHPQRNGHCSDSPQRHRVRRDSSIPSALSVFPR
jgi:carbamoyltransferase-like protein